MRRLPDIRILTCALLAAGCGAEPALDDDVRVTVENGVTIVVNPGLHIADTLGLRIDTAAAVRIGVVEGAPEYMIGRLAGVLRRADGTILIADAEAYELRVYGADGRFLRRVGRAGSGPGEYGRITAMQRMAGDSVAVLDNEGGRVTILDPDLNFVRTFRPRLVATRAQPPMASHGLVGFLGDGSPLLYDFLNVCGAARMDGFCEDSVAFFRTRGDGETAAEFGRHVFSRNLSIRVMPGLLTGWGEPLPQAFWRVGADRFYYADAKRFEVRVFRTDGTLERVVRVDAPPPAWSRDQVFTQPAPRTPPPDERAAEAMRLLAEERARAQLPDTLPHFSDMLIGDDGSIWLREYVPASLDVMPRWFVFDAEGRLRHALRSPPGMVRQPATWTRWHPQVGADFVLSPERGEYGVESVALYPLRRVR